MANLGYISQNFWKDKKVLITGHSGFKGSWLTQFILNLDSKVLGVSLEKIDLAHENLSQVVLDIRELRRLTRVITKFQPDIVLHLAAQSFVSEGYRSPIETLAINTIGTANVLESCRGLKSISSILIITTDKVYEESLTFDLQMADNSILSHKVSDPLGANEIYGASKASAEIITSAYRESFFAPLSAKSNSMVGIATARAGNVLGPNDWGINRLVPDFFRSYKNSNSLKLRNPRAVRPWQHVFDLCVGYILLIQNLSEYPIKFSKAWNFGNQSTECDVLTLVTSLNTKLISKGKTNVNIEEFVGYENFRERKILRINSKETEHELAWSPEFNIESMAENLVDGYLLENIHLRIFRTEASRLFMRKYLE
jgi:CDP-glucose 4,6-dehydratase